MIICKECNYHPCKCKETLPVNPTNLFGAPFDCRKQKRTRRFTSPNSKLTPEEFQDLQICIEAINHLLRSLGSEKDANNTRQLQLHFLNLKGIRVKASILCGLDLQEDERVNNGEFNMESNRIMNVDENVVDKLQKNKAVARNKIKRIKNNDESTVKYVKSFDKKGKLANAGRDYLQINPVGSALFIQYSRLLSITRDDCNEEERDRKFINADEETRRELTFNFGEFVSKNSDVENLFFGIPLFKALEKYVGKEVKVSTDEEILHGTLDYVSEGYIQIQNKKNKIEIDIRAICYLQVLDLK